MIVYDQIKKYPQEIRDELIEAIEKLPPDTPKEDVMERLYMIDKIERGIKQLNADKKSLRPKQGYE